MIEKDLAKSYPKWKREAIYKYRLLRKDIGARNGKELPKILGRFASMRNDYLRENKPVMYEQMIREGRLRTHLEETDTEARRMREYLIEQMLKSNPAPDRKYQLEWVGHMNSLKRTAEEIVIAELIYAGLWNCDKLSHAEWVVNGILTMRHRVALWGGVNRFFKVRHLAHYLQGTQNSAIAERFRGSVAFGERHRHSCVKIA